MTLGGENTLRSPSPVLRIHSEIPRQIRSSDWSFWPWLLLLIHGGAKVEIDTLSYKEGAEAVHWCDGSPEFRLEFARKSVAPPSPYPPGRRTGISRIGASASW